MNYKMVGPPPEGATPKEGDYVLCVKKAFGLEEGRLYTVSRCLAQTDRIELKEIGKSWWYRGGCFRLIAQRQPIESEPAVPKGYVRVPITRSEGEGGGRTGTGCIAPLGESNEPTDRPSPPPSPSFAEHLGVLRKRVEYEREQLSKLSAADFTMDAHRRGYVKGLEKALRIMLEGKE